MNSIEDEDRISRLPDDLLGHMLSIVPIKTAVSTSVLSTGWRHLFTLMHSLSFDDQGWESEELLLDTATGVLKVHQKSSIKKFSLLTPNFSYDKNSSLQACIEAVMLKDLQELHLSFFKSCVMFPNSLFNCQTLMVLKLESFSLWSTFNIPESVCLPSLKFLYLHNFEFGDSESVGRFFAGCSQLEELNLSHCSFGSTYYGLVISTPHLRELTVDSCFGNVKIHAPSLANLTHIRSYFVDVASSFSETSSIVKAELNFVFFGIPSDTGGLEAARGVVRGIRNATDIRLLGHSLELFPSTEHYTLPAYTSLKRLQLGRYCAGRSMEYVTYLLGSSPHLESVIFKEGLHSCSSVSTNVIHTPFSSRVKLIEVHNFCSHEVVLHRLQYLLANTGVLERLILYKSPDMTTEQELLLKKRLSMLPRVSRHCCIELK